MALYAIVDNGVIVEYKQLATAVFLPGKLYRKTLPVVVTDPPYNPTTQIKTGPVITVEETRVTQVWTVVDKSPAQIQAEHDERRDFVTNMFDQQEDLMRAAILVIMDELNLHSARLQSILTAGTAGTYANFRTAMNAIQSIPTRTPNNIRAAIRSKLGQ